MRLEERMMENSEEILLELEGKFKHKNIFQFNRIDLFLIKCLSKIKNTIVVTIQEAAAVT